MSTDKQFTGHQAEGEFIFMKARFYDPTVGRFLQPDSIVPDPMNPQSLNRYSYVYNNPMSYTDPTGHASQENAWQNCFVLGCGGPRSTAPRMMAPTPIGSNVLTTPFATPCPPWEACAVSAIGGLADFGGLLAAPYISVGCSVWTVASARNCSGERASITELLLADVDILLLGKGKAASAGARAGTGPLGTFLRRFAAEELGALRIGGETRATRLGRAIHTVWDYGPGFEREYKLPSGARVDAINFETREIIELKPNNAQAIRRGHAQLDRYLSELEVKFPGKKSWTGWVQPYGP